MRNVEEPVYAVADLVSEIGGTVGLFLGFSLVQMACMFTRPSKKLKKIFKKSGRMGISASSIRRSSIVIQKITNRFVSDTEKRFVV